MDPVLVAIIGVLLGGLFLKAAEYTLSGPSGSKALPEFDVNKVRALEMEIWGYYFTPLPESEKPKTLPVPPKGPGGGSSLSSCAYPSCQNTSSSKYCQRCRADGRDKRVYFSSCHVCHRDVARGNDTCQKCMLDILRERRAAREGQPRWREIGGKRVPMPPDVPDHAHLALDYDPVRLLEQAVWRWTNPSTGQTMHRVSILSPEIMNVYSDQYMKPILTIGTEKVKK